jgi:superfamily II DNA or RNA helicase
MEIIMQSKDEIQYTKYKNKYVTIINDYLNDTTLYKDYYIYEVLYAIELKMILWEDLPPNFDEVYKLPHRRDYGIDLINLNYEETAQVKLYGNKSNITWSHFSNFYTYSKELLNISNMILATTEDAKLDSLVLNIFEKNKKIKLFRNKFDDLISAIPGCTNHIKNNKNDKNDIKIEEREYLLKCNEIAIDTKKDKLYFQLPCGTGKTYIILYIIKESLKNNKNSKFVVLCPWVDLAKQTFDLFCKFNIKTSFVGDGKRTFNKKSNVIVCVNRSIQYIRNVEFKYKFIDEAHHVENEDSKIRQQINTIKSEKEINLSATYNDQYNIDFNYSMEQAIDEGYISDYVINIEHFSKGDKTEELIKLIKKNVSWAPMFIYFNNTDKCIKFSDLLNDENIKSNYLTGSDTMNKRETIKNGIIDGKIKVLCLCGVYNEGISIDNLQTVIFGDLRHSQINKIQIAMRANRLHNNKPYYRIVMPIVDDDFTNNDIKELIRTFAKIDPRIKKAIKNRSTSRIKINIDNNDNEIALLLYESIYDRLGNMIEQTDFNEWKELLFEYANTYKKSPTSIFVYNEKNIGTWLQYNKGKITSNKDKMYKILCENKYIKKSVDNYLENKEKNKDKIHLTFNELKELLFEYANTNKCAPSRKIIYKDQNIGTWLQTRKGNIMSNTDVIYCNLSKNKYIKQHIDTYLENKEKNKSVEKTLFEEWRQLLLDYISEYKTYPQTKTIYKHKTLGRWTVHLKEKVISPEDKLYINLSENKYIKLMFDDNLKKKEKNKVKIKLTFDEWKQLLFEYTDINKKCPSGSTVYKKSKIGWWLQTQKSKLDTSEDELYNILSINNYIKKSLDIYLLDRKNKKNVKLTFDETTQLLFDYANNNYDKPTRKTKYKGKCIGSWFDDQKRKIESTDDELYKLFSKNKHIKKAVDEYLVVKEKNSNCVKISFDEWKSLLFEYSEENKCHPTINISYKQQDIGGWFKRQKTKITSKNDDLYIVLCTNKYIQMSLDDCIEFKNNNK